MDTKILIVDDEDRFRRSVTRLLNESGCMADAAPNGPEALDKLVAREFDVVLLDINMPGMSGEATFEAIKERGFDVETIFLTGQASMNDAIRLLQQGAFDYLLKPADIGEIAKVVRRAMQKKLIRHGKVELAQILKDTALD
ncbi:response regulator [Salidesulfovibrio onnuriiensis]|uniref:response regulator n=1 Tax=Salidesulfovibrio onnuriiensis TaxID=2583823 RepID=UPI001650298C|nr:response regulator [Salidesulfovibrio onnuriiensis]